MDSIGRFMLWIVFVLSAILALVFFYNAQEMPVAQEVSTQLTQLNVFGSIMALMALVSGFGLAKIR